MLASMAAILLSTSAAASALLVSASVNILASACRPSLLSTLNAFLHCCHTVYKHYCLCSRCLCICKCTCLSLQINTFRRFALLPCSFRKVSYMTSSECSMPRFGLSHWHNCICPALPSLILQPLACLSLQAIAVADFIAFPHCCHAPDTQHFCGCHHCLWLCQ